QHPSQVTQLAKSLDKFRIAGNLLLPADATQPREIAKTSKRPCGMWVLSTSPRSSSAVPVPTRGWYEPHGTLPESDTVSGDGGLRRLGALAETTSPRARRRPFPEQVDGQCSEPAPATDHRKTLRQPAERAQAFGPGECPRKCVAGHNDRNEEDYPAAGAVERPA